MKSVKRTNRDELRAEYKLSDFPGGFVRGKYASRLRKSSNIASLTNRCGTENHTPNKALNWTRKKATRRLARR